jgi:sterol 24-C-methyltransferase
MVSAIEAAGPGDGRVNKRIENYTAFWQKDMNKEATADTENRTENYTDVVNGTLSARADA